MIEKKIKTEERIKDDCVSWTTHSIEKPGYRPFILCKQSANNHDLERTPKLCK